MQVCDYLVTGKATAALTWRKCHGRSAGAEDKPQTGTDAYAANSSPSARKKAIDRENVLSIGDGLYWYWLRVTRAARTISGES
jgi:hypothetical protein